MTDSQVYTGVAVLGSISGMRCLSSPAMVAGLAQAGLLPVRNKPLELLAHPASVAISVLLATGELIADKMPSVPARITAGPLVTRIISGAMCGAAITSAKERSVLFGVLIGVCAAVGSAYASYHLRRSAGERSGIPDPVLAVVEDAVVAASGWLVYRSLLVQTSGLPACAQASQAQQKKPFIRIQQS